MALEALAVVSGQFFGTDDHDGNFAPILVFVQFGDHFKTIHHGHA